jgi:hypothetical protein
MIILKRLISFQNIIFKVHYIRNTGLKTLIYSYQNKKSEKCFGKKIKLNIIVL